MKQFQAQSHNTAWQGVYNKIHYMCDTEAALKAVIEMNQTHVTLIETKIVTLHDHEACSAHSQTRAAASLEKHTARRAGRFAKVTRLNAAAPPIISLTADVVIPPTSGIYVLQNLFAHGDLSTESSYGTTRNEAAKRFIARCLTHGDVKRFGVAEKGTILFITT